MTAREFYGPAYDQLRQAEKQVLEEIRRGRKTWRENGRQAPVLYTASRIKTPDSMCRKLTKRGLPATRQAALTQVRDAVGVRVICAFQDDVYLVAKWLEERPDFVVLETKDYISYPKENGYRSYHLILGIRAGAGKGMTVEVQLRTIAIDFWASLEHQLKYKKEVPHEGLIREELRRCADEIASVDLSMETIRELLAGSF
ncbi:MAG TPA: RelA/SpoT domain protein [Candidatus Evtepia faecigallinarum]|nr:RelA/SpoT domain protein [Candidatus Evtepia faecigallinarum]